MAKRGRKPGFVMPEEHRVKIKNSNILNALIEHIEGDREMSATQVSAGLGLLRKALPDLSSVTLSGDEDNPIVHKHEGADEFRSRIAGIASRAGSGKANGHANGGTGNGSAE